MNKQTRILMMSLAVLCLFSGRVFALAGAHFDNGSRGAAAGPFTGADTGAADDCKFCHWVHSVANPNNPQATALLPRGATQQTMCRYCHTLGGFGAAIAFDQSNHSVTKDSGNGGAAKIVDCGMCHDVHNDTLTVTDPHDANVAANRRLLRGDVNKYLNDNTPATERDTPNGPFSADAPTPLSYQADGDPLVNAALNNSRRPCQVCHDETTYYVNNAAEGVHEIGSTCTTCHSHQNGFAAAFLCVNCHDTEQDDAPVGNARRAIVDKTSGSNDDMNLGFPHVSDDTNIVNADCEVCHVVPSTGGTAHRSGSDSETYLADPNGAGIVTFVKGTPSDATHEAYCLACHDTDGTNDFVGPLTAIAPFTGAATRLNIAVPDNTDTRNQITAAVPITSLVAGKTWAASMHATFNDVVGGDNWHNTGQVGLRCFATGSQAAKQGANLEPTGCHGGRNALHTGDGLEGAMHGSTTNNLLDVLGQPASLEAACNYCHDGTKGNAKLPTMTLTGAHQTALTAATIACQGPNSCHWVHWDVGKADAWTACNDPQRGQSTTCHSGPKGGGTGTDPNHGGGAACKTCHTIH